MSFELVKPLLRICSKGISCKRKKKKNLLYKDDSMSSVISKLETTEMFLHTGMDKVQCNNFLKYVTFKKKRKKIYVTFKIILRLCRNVQACL